MDINELRQKGAEFIRANEEMVAKAQSEGRAMTDDELKEFDKRLVEFDKIQADVVRMEKQAAASATLQRTNSPFVASAADPAQNNDQSEFRDMGEFLIEAIRGKDRRLETRTTQQTGIGSAGGFLVPKKFLSEILKLDPLTQIVRPRATVIPAGDSPDAEISIPALQSSNNVYGGVTVTWSKEAATKGATDAVLEQITLSPKEVSGYIDLTQKLMNNSMAVGAFLQEQLRNAVNLAEDAAFVIGDGVSKPKGFLKSGCKLTSTRTTAKTVKYADIVSMYTKSYLSGARLVWVVSPSAYAEMLKMEDTDGHLIFQNAISEGANARLLGYPVLQSFYSPAVGTEGDVALVDLSKYIIKDGSPLAIDFGTPEFKKGVVTIRAMWNVDGACWVNAPAKVNGYQVSPVVVLETK